MYTIAQSLLGQNCANWDATTYTHPSLTTNNLKVSQAVGNFYV
jgi:hypothetical protein